MARLIDADALKTAFPCGEYVRTESVRATIDSMPTIDTEPVRHGKWRLSRYYPHIVVCDECGEPFDLSISLYHWNYCPYCGIKMDVDEVNDETKR